MLFYVTFLLIAFIAYKVFHNPLRLFPGWWYSQFTGAIYWSHLLRGKHYLYIHSTHKRFGKYVRISPNSVSITDTVFLNSLLTYEKVKRPEIVRIVLQLFPNVDNLISFSDKNKHKQIRKIVMQAFAQKYVDSLEPLVNRSIDDLFKCIDDAGNQQVNIVKLLQSMTLDIIGSVAFGQSFGLLAKKETDLMESIQIIFQEFNATTFLKFLYPPLADYRRIPSVNKALDAVDHLSFYIRKILKERRQLNESGKKPNDMLQFLLDATDPDTGRQLSDAELESEIGLFLIAGSETTSRALFWTLYLLSNHANVKNKVQQEIDAFRGELDAQSFKQLPYLNAVINESMRLFPPAAEGGVLEAEEDIVAPNGLIIPKGVQIQMPIYTIHRDGENWNKEDEFNPERFMDSKSKHLEDKVAFSPFNHGPRSCLGRPLAMMELRMILAKVLKNYSFVIDSESIEGTLSLTLGPGKECIMAHFEKRQK